MRTQLLVLGAGLATAAVAEAQDDRFEQLALRVSSVRPNGDCVIDRGTRDLVQVGDRVVLSPRNGPAVQGRVTEVDGRTALVELVDRNVVLPIGTRGNVMIPRARRAAAAPAKPTPDPNAPQPQPAEPDKPPDDWRPGMPLLGSTRPPRPEERSMSIAGRVYGAANLVRTLDSFSQSYLRAGTDVVVDNIQGDGGTLHMHGEFDWSEEFTENTGMDLRVFDFSYAHGGTRWQPLRWQVGRFLMHDMPEFGVLDGVEVGYRRENGDRIGGSIGWLPELDEDLESFADLQVSMWYLGTDDVAERVTWGVGYQKTWHRWDTDRDLFVFKGRYLPIDGWDLSASLWVDLYVGKDDLKNRTVEATRINAFATRRWEREGGLEFVYDHEAYPEQLRRELPQTIQPLTIADAHQDRLTGHAYWLGESSRTHVRGTGWIDEERAGGAAELGLAITGLVQTDATTGLVLFGVQGLTSSVLGARIDHGGDFSFGRLDLLYEIGLVHHEGFPSDVDDLLQHRLAGLLTSDFGGQWNCTLFADGTWWDQEISLGVGAYVERSF